MKIILLNILVSIFIYCAIPSVAENLLKEGNCENPDYAKLWSNNTTFISTNAHSGKGCFGNNYKLANFAFHPELIEIDPTKKYRFTGWFKVLSDKKDYAALIFLTCYDANRHPITQISFLPLKDSPVSKLERDARKGDKEIMVADCWRLAPKLLYGVAFNAKDDLSDLPNYNSIIIRKYDRGRCLLANSLKRDYAAGNPVRLHRYIDHLNKWLELNNAWRKAMIEINGMDKPGEWTGNKKFRSGTKYVGISIIGRYKHGIHDGNALILFDDLVFEEIE